MQDSMIKWLVWIVCAFVIASGVAVFLAALFRDRARGRKRCPKCWYDLSGVPGADELGADVPDDVSGISCPECGRTYARPAQLLRTRRRWRLATLGVLVCLVGYAGILVRQAIIEGWAKAVPSSVLVMFWPISEKDWLDNDFAPVPASDQAFWELHDRLQEGRLWGWQERWWTQRVEEYAKKNRRFGNAKERETLSRLGHATIALDRPIASTDDLVRRVFETTGIAVSMPSVRFKTAIGATSGSISSFDALLLGLNQLKWTMSQSSSSGASASLQLHFDEQRVVVLDDAGASNLLSTHFIDATAALRRIQDHWRPLSSETASSQSSSANCNRAGPPDPILNTPALRDEFVQLCVTILHPEDWAVNGGQFSISHCGNTLIMQAPPRNAIAVESIIDQFVHPADLSVNREMNPAEANLRKLERTAFRVAEKIVTVDELLRAVQASSNVAIQQDFAFMSPVLLDVEAREVLSRPDATCVTALDQAVRCVTDSKVFPAYWTPTSSGARLLPQALYIEPDVRVYDLLPILQGAANEGPNFVNDTIADLLKQITTSVDQDNWAENGGDLNRMQFIGTFLVVSAPVRTQIGVQRLLSLMKPDGSVN